MPTYQYKCTNCDADFEIVQAFTDDALTDCPSCEGRLRKVFSAVGVVFKGSGFYATDNRTKGKTNAAAGTSDASNASSPESSAPAAPSSDTSTPASSTPAATTGASPTKTPAATSAA